MTFNINAHIDEAEWDIARATFRAIPPGSFWDHWSLPRIHVLWGQIQLTHDDMVLFPPDQLSVIMGRELNIRKSVPWVYPSWRKQEAAQSANINLSGAYMSSLEWVFKLTNLLSIGLHAGDDHKDVMELCSGDILIQLEQFGNTVDISSSLFDTPKLIVPIDEFLMGGHEFICDIVRRISIREPSILNWDALYPTLKFASTN